MSKKEEGDPAKIIPSDVLTSQIIAVTVGGRKTFYLHKDILITESEAFLKSLTGAFREAGENAVEMKDEDPELFGFFVEYLYRGCPIFFCAVNHYSEFEILARLYAMGERLMAPKFQSYALRRFTKSFSSDTTISDEVVCELLRVACEEITERATEDPMRSQIFWFAASRIETLRESPMFRQLLNDIQDLGKYLCLWIGKDQPQKASEPHEAGIGSKFKPESMYSL